MKKPLPRPADIGKCCAAFWRRRNGVSFFAVLVLSGCFVFLLRCMIFGSDAFLATFHKHGQDLCMDFFNSARDAAQGVGAYTERGVMYPPMANAFFWLFARMIPRTYLDTPIEQNGTWVQYPAAILTYFLFVILSLAMLAFVLLREPHGQKKGRLLALSVLVSFPLIFLCERGNSVLFCLPFILFFSQTCGEQDPRKRELGLLALAFATSMKYYPALFAFVLLSERRYREFFRFALYTFLMFLIPSFFFGGPICVLRSMLYVVRFSEAQGSLFADFMAGFGISGAVASRLLLGFYALCFLLFALSSLVPQRRFVLWAFGMAVCLCVSSIYSPYNCILFLPALLQFLREEEVRGKNICYFLLLSLPFAFYAPKAWHDGVLVGAIALLAILCAVEALPNVWRALRDRKSAQGKTI